MAEDDLPPWLRPLADTLPTVASDQMGRPPPNDARPSAVLVLFGDGPDLLLIERAGGLRSHAGQPAFPGGAAEPGDTDLRATALREAEEEVGLDPSGVRILGEMAPLYISVSRYAVTPILAWWRMPCAVRAVDPAEVARVARVPIADLADPGNRCLIRYGGGRAGPGFVVGGMTVWGFTAIVIDRLLSVGGWARSWDGGAVRDLPSAASAS
jgi:8-oxo-dGTP pyrophosphatase MutT (NUDIX family)